MRKIAALFAVILFSSLIATAQMSGMPDRPRQFNRFWANPFIVNQLGLTDAQIKQFDQLAINTGMKLVDEHAAIQKQQLGILSLFIPDKLDESALNQQVDSLLAAETSAKKTIISAILQGYNLLTPEQQKKAKVLLQNPEFMRRLHEGIGRQAGMGMGMGMGMRSGAGMGLGMGQGQKPPQPPRPAQPAQPPKPPEQM